MNPFNTHISSTCCVLNLRRKCWHKNIICASLGGWRHETFLSWWNINLVRKTKSKHIILTECDRYYDGAIKEERKRNNEAWISCLNDLAISRRPLHRGVTWLDILLKLKKRKDSYWESYCRVKNASDNAVSIFF